MTTRPLAVSISEYHKISTLHMPEKYLVFGKIYVDKISRNVLVQAISTDNSNTRGQTKLYIQIRLQCSSVIDSTVFPRI